MEDGELHFSRYLIPVGSLFGKDIDKSQELFGSDLRIEDLLILFKYSSQPPKQGTEPIEMLPIKGSTGENQLGVRIKYNGGREKIFRFLDTRKRNGRVVVRKFKVYLEGSEDMTLFEFRQFETIDISIKFKRVENFIKYRYMKKEPGDTTD
jgi:hypothetical protein